MTTPWPAATSRHLRSCKEQARGKACKKRTEGSGERASYYKRATEVFYRPNLSRHHVLCTKYRKRSTAVSKIKACTPITQGKIAKPWKTCGSYEPPLAVRGRHQAHSLSCALRLTECRHLRNLSKPDRTPDAALLTIGQQDQPRTLTNSEK